jgi:hypothetical protein
VQAGAEEKELSKAAQKYDALLDLAVQNNVDTLEIEEQYQLELAAIQDKFRDERAAKVEADRIADIEADRDIDQQKLDAANALNEARLSIGRQYFSAINTLATVFAGNDVKRARKAFGVSKALGIAEATASTYVAANVALADPTIPTPLKPFAVAGIIASGFANVAKIAATKFQPSGGGGGASGGGGAPSLNFGGGEPQRTPNIGAVQLGAQQQSIQAYVIEQNVSNSQQANQRIKEVSAL